MDQFGSFNGGLTAPASGAFAVEPSTGVVFTQPPRALYVGLGGDVSVEMLEGQTIDFANVPDGTLLPIRVRRVLPGTTAMALVGLY